MGGGTKVKGPLDYLSVAGRELSHSDFLLYFRIGLRDVLSLQAGASMKGGTEMVNWIVYHEW